tara:strand:+ start:2946 stop:3122 length:177 start_codon:yes stop_codon:yes gene_type:complete
MPKKHRGDSYYTCIKCRGVFQGFGYKQYSENYRGGYACKECSGNGVSRFTRDFKEENV